MDGTNQNLLIRKLSDLLHGSGLASLEILPGGLKEWESVELPLDAPKPSIDFPFILVEGNLGIPNKVLRALYLVAVSTKWRTASPLEVKSASIIVALLNPAHQTALNARKTLIENGHIDPRDELRLMELMSRGSPECAKQSIIWDHRRWCFVHTNGIMKPLTLSQPRQCWASPEEAQSFPKIAPLAIEHELLLIHHTCASYPRNYHGWVHWHFIIDVCCASLSRELEGENQREFLGILLKEQQRMRRWIEQHVSDYSAMYQFCQIHDLIKHLKARHLLPDEPDEELASEPFDHALSLVNNYPNHESLWMYLRIALSHAALDKRTTILEKIKSQNDSQTTNFRKQLFRWCEVGRDDMTTRKFQAI